MSASSRHNLFTHWTRRSCQEWPTRLPKLQGVKSKLAMMEIVLVFQRPKHKRQSFKSRGYKNLKVYLPITTNNFTYSSIQLTFSQLIGEKKMPWFQACGHPYLSGHTDCLLLHILALNHRIRNSYTEPQFKKKKDTSFLPSDLPMKTQSIIFYLCPQISALFGVCFCPKFRVHYALHCPMSMYVCIIKEANS